MNRKERTTYLDGGARARCGRQGQGCSIDDASVKARGKGQQRVQWQIVVRVAGHAGGGAQHAGDSSDRTRQMVAVGLRGIVRGECGMDRGRTKGGEYGRGARTERVEKQNLPLSPRPCLGTSPAPPQHSPAHVRAQERGRRASQSPCCSYVRTCEWVAASGAGRPMATTKSA
jgi:hypothetical protein